MATRIVSLRRRGSVVSDYTIALACGVFLGCLSGLFV